MRALRIAGLVSILIAPCLYAQTPSAANDDRSFYEGQPVPHPEQFSGVWEAPNGRQGAVGLHLTLMTTIPADAKTLAGATQSWQHLEISVYERYSPEIVWGSWNNFYDGPRGGGATLEKGRLQLHFAGTPAVDLDLLQQSNGDWKGRFHRGSFDAQVTLRRSATTGSAKINPLVGTWQSQDLRACVHVVEHPDGTLGGWSDALQLPERIRYAPTIKRPESLLLIYGQMMKVQQASTTNVTFTFNPYSGMCCPHDINGVLASDAESILVPAPVVPNRPSRDQTWKKLEGDFCVVEHP